jgi:predicted DNA-binding ribbon-helix-helix protein
MGRPLKGKSVIARRSIYIKSRKSTVYVESAFWASLKEIATAEGISLKELLTRIDGNRCTPNFSSAIRLYVLNYYARPAKKRLDDEHQSTLG